MSKELSLKNYDAVGESPDTLDECGKDLEEAYTDESIVPLFMEMTETKGGQWVCKVGVSTMCGTAILLFFGLASIIVAINWWCEGHNGVLPFMTIGILAFIPGCYGSYEVIGALRGWRGFEHYSENTETGADSWERL